VRFPPVRTYVPHPAYVPRPLRLRLEHFARHPLVIQWVPTAEMPADGLTKPLNKQAHQAFLEMLGLKDIRHLIK
jgi:hypothetical protein